jgi:hypothetical protein
MSADRIDWCDYVEPLLATVPDWIHPGGRQIIHELHCELRDAVCREDIDEIVRLIDAIEDKRDLEIRFSCESWVAMRPPYRNRNWTKHPLTDAEIASIRHEIEAAKEGP